jgi:hypothetical protein
LLRCGQDTFSFLLLFYERLNYVFGETLSQTIGQHTAPLGGFACEGIPGKIDIGTRFGQSALFDVPEDLTRSRIQYPGAYYKLGRQSPGTVHQIDERWAHGKRAPLVSGIP